MDDEDVFEDAVEDLPPSKRSENNNIFLEPPPPPSTSSRSGSTSPASSTGSTSKRRFKFPKRSKNKDSGSSSDSAEIPLGDALEEAKFSVDLFLNNQYDEAKNIVQPLADRSIYHALGYGVFMYLKAVMTFEQKDLEEASSVLGDACETIGRYRRKTGIAENLGRIVRKTDYNAYTEIELHAELCHAECLLLKAVLTFHEDETLVSFVKAGLKVRSCYQSFRECWNALNQRDWANSAFRQDFESGVRLGAGGFNLMISLLPARIMKLLEFIGFAGNRETGLREIQKVYEDKTGMRHFLGALVLLGYHLLLTFYIGSSQYDLDLCKEILDEKLESYPEGAFYKFFKGRYHFVQGQVDDAILWYTSSVESQNDWPQFHHICYWELYWATLYSRQWWRTLHYANRLLEESKWSKCMYAYHKAAVMCMVQGELTEEQRMDQIDLMRNTPKWRQRIAGKSLPMEKFASKKAERFLEQGNHLCLPALELIYVWNGFKILGQQYSLVEPIYVLVEETCKRLEKNKASVKYYEDDLCLLNLLMGMCLKNMKSPLQAEECLKVVMSHAGKLKQDTYLVPYATFEYAQLLREDSGQVDLAMQYLESAKNDFKDFSLQSRLHFRIHAAQTEIRKQREANCKDGTAKEKGKKKKKKTKKEKQAENGLEGHSNEDSLTDDEENYNDDEDDDEISFHEAEDGILPLSDSTPATTKSGQVDHGQLVKESMSEEDALKIIQGR